MMDFRKYLLLNDRKVNRKPKGNSLTLSLGNISSSLSPGRVRGVSQAVL